MCKKENAYMYIMTDSFRQHLLNDTVFVVTRTGVFEKMRPEKNGSQDALAALYGLIV